MRAAVLERTPYPVVPAPTWLVPVFAFGLLLVLLPVDCIMSQVQKVGLSLLFNLVVVHFASLAVLCCGCVLGCPAYYLRFGTRRHSARDAAELLPLKALCLWNTAPDYS